MSNEKLLRACERMTIHVLILLLTNLLCCSGVRPTSQDNDGTSVTASGHFQSQKQKAEFSDAGKLLGTSQIKHSSGGNISNPFEQHSIDSNKEFGAHEAESLGSLDSGSLDGSLDQDEETFDREASLTQAQTVMDRYESHGSGDKLMLYELKKPSVTGEEGEFLRGRPDETDIRFDQTLHWDSYFAAKETSPPSHYVEAYIRNEDHEPGYEKFYVRKWEGEPEASEQIVHLAPGQDEDEHQDGLTHGEVSTAVSGRQSHSQEESDVDLERQLAESGSVEQSGQSGTSRPNGVVMTRMSRMEAAEKRKKEGKGISKRYEPQALEDPQLDRFIGAHAAAESNAPHPKNGVEYFKNYEKVYENSLKHGADKFLKHSQTLTESADAAWYKIHDLMDSVDNTKSTLQRLAKQVDNTNAQVTTEREDMQSKARSAFAVAARTLGSNPYEFANKVKSNFETGRLEDDELFEEGMKHKESDEKDLFESDAYPSKWKPLEVEDQFQNPTQWSAPDGQSSSRSRLGVDREDSESFPESSD